MLDLKGGRAGQGTTGGWDPVVLMEVGGRKETEDLVLGELLVPPVLSVCLDCRAGKVREESGAEQDCQGSQAWPG